MGARDSEWRPRHRSEHKQAQARRQLTGSARDFALGEFMLATHLCCLKADEFSWTACFDEATVRKPRVWLNQETRNLRVFGHLGPVLQHREVLEENTRNAGNPCYVVSQGVCFQMHDQKNTGRENSAVSQALQLRNRER